MAASGSFNLQLALISQWPPSRARRSLLKRTSHRNGAVHILSCACLSNVLSHPSLLLLHLSLVCAVSPLPPAPAPASRVCCLAPPSCPILRYQWTSLTDGQTESERGPEAETPRSAAAEDCQHSACWPGLLRHHQTVAAFPPRSLMTDFPPQRETERAEQPLDVQSSVSVCRRRGRPVSGLTPLFISLPVREPQEGLGHASSPSGSWLGALTAR